MMSRTTSLARSIRSAFKTSKQKAKDEESNLEGIDLPEIQPEETIEPPESYQCNNKCRQLAKSELIL